MNAVEDVFSGYLNETNSDSRQIYFVNQIVEYIIHNGMLKDLSVRHEPPFTDRGNVAEKLLSQIRKEVQENGIIFKAIKKDR